jgi:hypothetical protein
MSERVIDEGREWRNFSDSDKDRSRAEGVDEFISTMSYNIFFLARFVFCFICNPDGKLYINVYCPDELTTDISRAPNLSGDLARMSKVQNRIAVGVLLQKHLIG